MQVHRRGLRFAFWAWTLLVMAPAALAAQSAVPPPVPVAGETSPPLPDTPAIPALPPPISPMPAAAPATTPPSSILGAIQQHRQQRFQIRQERRHHMVEKVKSLFGSL